MINISCYHNCTVSPPDTAIQGSLHVIGGIVISIITLIALAVMFYMFLGKKSVCRITHMIGDTLTHRRDQNKTHVIQKTSRDQDISHSTISVNLTPNKDPTTKLFSDNCKQIDNEGFSAFDEEITKQNKLSV